MGHEKFIFYEFDGGTGVQEVKKKIFVSKFPQILVVVSKFLRFSTISEVKTKKKKKKGLRLKISTNSGCRLKIFSILGVLGLDLHASSPELINFFGAQSLLGGAQVSFGGHKQSFKGARPRNAPRGAGPGWKHFHFTISLV